MKRVIRVLFSVVMSLSVLTMVFTSTTTEAAAATSTISSTRAKKIALADAGLSKSQVKRLEVESDGKYYEVEFVKTKTGTKYEYDIAKAGGKIREKSAEIPYKRNSSKKKVGKTAVLKRVAKASGIKKSIVNKGTCKYRYKKGQGTYEVKFRHNGRAYEYEVLAPTNKIIEWEISYLR